MRHLNVDWIHSNMSAWTSALKPDNHQVSKISIEIAKKLLLPPMQGDFRHHQRYVDQKISFLCQF